MTEPLPLCPDCGALPGEPHDPNCDVAECNGCGKQRLWCAMSGDCGKHDPAAAIWRGEWSGVRGCWARGWWVIWTDDRGWVRCPEGAPGATEDLSRWSHYRQTGCDGPRERSRG